MTTVYYWWKLVLSTLTSVQHWFSLTTAQLKTRGETTKLTGQNFFNLPATYGASTLFTQSLRPAHTGPFTKLVQPPWPDVASYTSVQNQETADSLKTERVYKQEAECVTTDIQHLIAIAECGKKKKKKRVWIKKKKICPAKLELSGSWKYNPTIDHLLNT